MISESQNAYKDFQTFPTVAGNQTIRANFLRRVTLSGYDGPTQGTMDDETLAALRALSEAGCFR